MPAFDDDLRAALRDLAEQAGPAGFAPGPLVRRARRLRARFAAIGVCCVLAVAAAAAGAAGVPAALRSTPPGPPAVDSNGWQTVFRCGPLPAGLPGPVASGYRISIGPATRTASGAPAVTWYLTATAPNGQGTIPEPTAAVVLLVHDGTVIAAQWAPRPTMRAIIPYVTFGVPQAIVERYTPRISACAAADWNIVWAAPQDYQVVIAATLWTSATGTRPNFLSATAELRKLG